MNSSSFKSNGSVGIVHPLELKTEERPGLVETFSRLQHRASVFATGSTVCWRAGISEYQVRQGVAETEINAMTFKGVQSVLAGCVGRYATQVHQLLSQKFSDSGG